jgi:cell division initiation protein
LRKAKQDFANDFRHLLKSFMEVMDNVDIASAKEIEASLRDRLDLESVAVAHEAAETRRLEAEREEHDEETVGASSAESGEAIVAATGTPTHEPRLGPDEQEEIGEPEVEEPEVEPSSVEDPPPEVPETAPSGPEVEEEVEREGTMPSGEGRAYDEFFQERESTEERQRFRASRFLRRRG